MDESLVLRNRLREARMEKGLSQSQLAQMVGVSRNTISSIETGQFTPQMQHDFVQSLGKAVAGTMLYVAGYALAKAGIVSGESDDDKDVQNFMKNTL